ncbi:Aldehyde/histidinol dehydrogenase [Zychaea mexicana]|uniref:Aldehyde/histidinol dehydrogenase n=1 Tax=Zychaea mexicana TaxID=64656 RepID=UPI0022FEC02A|nr:Aldehyde/histidinol dehydrogenase [Zychaea mexicana]KAI9498249.1 Aldehyde/histidinol dehydrogenase [Zychaea mexicana]
MAVARFTVEVPETLEYTSLDTIEDSVSVVRNNYITGRPRNMYWRKFQLHRLHQLVKDHEEKFYEALAKDMGKSRHEALMGDISPLLEECLYFLDNIEKLAKDEKVQPRQITNRFDQCIIRKDPLGVVLILGCWNYPVQLPLVPLAGAIAAGNAAIIKLSETAVHTSALITKLFPKYMDISCYRIVNGGVPETTALLEYKFDHIFYTGSSTVAKIIMTAAAKHLTPVTLELGGKSPAVITADANIKTVANRVAFGKFFNTGQSCVGVDYVLIPKNKLEPFVDALRKTITDWFGANPKESKDYGRIVSVRHFDRIMDLLDRRQSGSIVIGGDTDREARYIAPTVVTNVSFNDPGLMTEEIFGPILPIVTYNELEDAVAMIKRQEPPLTVYVFANKKEDQRKVIDYLPSGGVCVNDTLMQFAEFSLPFGGVGNSGLGKYHGKRSYELFTHERSMLIKKQRFEFLMRARYPPYSAHTLKLLRASLLSSSLTTNRIIYKRGIKNTFIFFLVILFFYIRKRLL